MTDYSHGNHAVCHHRYHVVWVTKYLYRILQGSLRLRVRKIIAQVAEEMDIKIVNGVFSADHIHIFASLPPHTAVSEFVKRAKRRSSRKIQQEFPEIWKRYWGRHFFGCGYFSSTSGNVTEKIIDAYLNNHVDAHRSDNLGNISLD